MRKIILILMLSIFLISFVSAVESLGTFKQGVVGECIVLSQTCGECSYNNITRVIKTGEDFEIYIINQNMTRDDTYYSLEFCNITKLGTYNVMGFGNPAGIKTSWNYYFDITGTGVKARSILENPLILIFLALFIIFFVLAYMTKMPWMGFISSLPLIFAGIYTMIYGFNNITNLYTRGISMMILGLGMAIMIIASYDWVSDAKEGTEFF